MLTFWKTLLLYQIRHKLFNISIQPSPSASALMNCLLQLDMETVYGAAQLGLHNKQRPFICAYRHWIPPGSLAKTDTRQPAHDGKDEETASCSNADVLFLSSMEVALRAFRVGQ